MRRPLLERFLRGHGRRLLYGRRKTGKTFYARYVLDGYQYFIVRRGGKIYDPDIDEEYDTSVFLRICRGGSFILDEFHRAEERLIDALHAGVCGGDNVIITSTLHYYRRFLGAPGAPLTGLYPSLQVGLVSPLNLLVHDWGVVDKGMLERLVFYQEPVLIGMSLEQIVLGGAGVAHTLVSEILTEEDYVYTERYRAVLEALAAGKTRLSEIAGYLYSRGLLGKPTVSHITKYMNTMTRIGLVEKIPVYGSRRRHVYRHVSPLTWIIYYLETRYGYGETPLTPGLVLRAAKTQLPLLIEVFFERLLAEAHGLRPVKVFEPEINIALARGRKLELVAEVKWTTKLSSSDIRRIEDKLHQIEARHRLLIVPAASIVPETSLEVMDIDKAIRLSRSISRQESM